MNRTPLIRIILVLFLLPFAVGCVAVPEPQARDYGYAEPFAGYSREELARMLAPIALYPDPLLSQILMASTYPVEVLEADRWLRANPGLHGDVLNEVLLDIDWDPSVKALCHFPNILATMAGRITETTDLGNAFLIQEAEVMGMIQELRAQAYARGNLISSPQQQVLVVNEIIIIQPADPRVVFVPVYDPFTIYGPWWYPAYRPVAWAPRGTSFGFGITYWSGSYFSFSFGTWSTFDWPSRCIFIDVHKRPRFVRHDRWFDKPGRWDHSPRHRKGVAYRDGDRHGRGDRHHGHDGDVRRDGRDDRNRDYATMDGDRRVEMPRGTVRNGGANGRDGDRTRFDRDREDRNRGDRERLEQARLEEERRARELDEQRRLEQARPERERLDRDRAERERREQARVEVDRRQREEAERTRLNQGRLDRERKEREQTERNRREQVRLERERQERDRGQRNRQEQARILRERQEQVRIQRERDRKEQAQVRQVRQEQDRRQSARVEPEPSNRSQAERVRKETVKAEKVRTTNDRTQRVTVEREKQERVQVERQPVRKTPAKVIRQAKEDRRENPSAQRSQVSQEKRNENSRDRGRSEEDNQKEERGTWGRNRR